MPSEAETGEHARRATLITAAASLVVGLVASLVAFKLRTVPIVSDPYQYVQAGVTFPQESWNMIGLTRYGIVLPLMVVTHFFHISELSFYLGPVVATGTMVAATFWTAARRFGHPAAVAAAVLLLANGAVLINATRGYPDIFAASTISVALALAVTSRDHWQVRRRWSPALVLLLLGTGLVLGLSWTMRETSVFAWPVIVGILLWRGGPPVLRTLLLVGSAALAVFAAELVVSALAFGDPLVRLKALAGTGQGMAGTVNPYDAAYLGRPRSSYLLEIPRVMGLQPDGTWMLVLGVLAVAGLVLFPRKAGPFALAFLVPAALLTLAGGALSPSSPNIRLDLPRYWLLFLPAMVLAAVACVACAVQLLGRLLRDRSGDGPARVLVTAVVVLLAIGITLGPLRSTADGVRANREYVLTNHDVMSRLRAWLHDHDRQVRVVYADLATSRNILIYSRSFDGTLMSSFRMRNLAPGVRPSPGAYVVLISRTDHTCNFCFDNNRALFAKEPGARSRWDLVWRSPSDTVEIYRVPRPEVPR